MGFMEFLPKSRASMQSPPGRFARAGAPRMTRYARFAAAGAKRFFLENRLINRFFT
jgi:hypothetical protein